MDHRAWFVLQDRVIAIDSVQGEAGPSALLRTEEERMAIIEAAGALAEVARHGSHRPDLWGGKSGECLRKDWKIPTQDRISRQLGQRDHGADPQGSILLAKLGQARQSLQVQ